MSASSIATTRRCRPRRRDGRSPRKLDARAARHAAAWRCSNAWRPQQCDDAHTAIAPPPPPAQPSTTIMTAPARPCRRRAAALPRTSNSARGTTCRVRTTTGGMVMTTGRRRTGTVVAGELAVIEALAQGAPDRRGAPRAERVPVREDPAMWASDTGSATAPEAQRTIFAGAAGLIIDLFPARADFRRFAGERLERIGKQQYSSIRTRRASPSAWGSPDRHRRIAAVVTASSQRSRRSSRGSTSRTSRTSTPAATACSPTTPA